ncbi:MAG: SOS response-associated peptidase [Myxococcota bacterium]
MCGRFALTAPASTIAEVFQVDVLPDLLPRYNIAPTTEIACVVQQDGHRELQSFRWGLIPMWAKDKKIAYQTLNARADTISKKPAFRAAFKRRRLLIVADGFYEWLRKDKKTKIPHLFQMADGKPFAIAGVWERWVDPADGTEVRSCSIVTTGPNSLMEPVHDRMPVILPPEVWDTWLDPQNADTAALQELLVPYPSDRMAARRVSRTVGDVKNKGADVQGPWEGED